MSQNYRMIIHRIQYVVLYCNLQKNLQIRWRSRQLWIVECNWCWWCKQSQIQNYESIILGIDKVILCSNTFLAFWHWNPDAMHYFVWMNVVFWQSSISFSLAVYMCGFFVCLLFFSLSFLVKLVHRIHEIPWEKLSRCN